VPPATQKVTLHALRQMKREHRKIVAVGLYDFQMAQIVDRSGSLDPGVLLYLIDELKMDARAIEKLLYQQSGLLGVSGISSDMRTLETSSEPGARAAIDLFAYRVKKYLGAYLAAMDGADAIVFAGGIGEHSPDVRARICKDLDWLGIRLDAAKNERMVGGEGRIDADGSRVALWVIPTDEELLIARDTWRVVTGVDPRL